MKKYLLLSAVALSFVAVPTLAHADEDGDYHPSAHGEKYKKGDHRKKMLDKLKEADTDGDGAVSKAEFLKKHEDMAEKRFEKMDKNGDGKLSPEDRPEGKGPRGKKGAE